MISSYFWQSPGVCGDGVSVTWCLKHLSKQRLEEQRRTAKGGDWHSSWRWQRERRWRESGEKCGASVLTAPFFRLAARKQRWDLQTRAAMAKLEIPAACKHKPTAPRELCTTPAEQVGSVHGMLLLVPIHSCRILTSFICVFTTTFFSCPPSAQVFLGHTDEKLIWFWRRTMELDVIIDNNWAKHREGFFFFASFFPNVSASLIQSESMDVIDFKMETIPKGSSSIDEG